MLLSELEMLLSELEMLLSELEMLLSELEMLLSELQFRNRRPHGCTTTLFTLPFHRSLRATTWLPRHAPSARTPSEITITRSNSSENISVQIRCFSPSLHNTLLSITSSSPNSRSHTKACAMRTARYPFSTCQASAAVTELIRRTLTPPTSTACS
jgi:hypothetical protein